MKTAFMGSDVIALPMLRHLFRDRPAGIELTTVFTQPDRKSGRGMRLQANAIKQWAQEENLTVLQPEKCGENEAHFLQQEQIKLVLVMAYGQILPKCILESCPVGVLNLHASLLPRLRGASPIHTAVALGLEETGVSLMRIVSKLDAGPVADMEKVSILPEDTSRSIMDKLAASCVSLMDRSLPGLVAGSLVFEEQNPAEVSYCRIIDKADAHLDFTRPVPELVNRVRALQPWPGTVFPFKGQDIRILSAEAVDMDTEDHKPGTLILDTEGAYCITCGTGAMRLQQMQRAGGKPLPADAFMRGFNVPIGFILESRSMRPLESPKAFSHRKKGNS